jgi:hypothetical protein
MQVFVDGIGLVGPGLEGWSASRAVLAGDAHYEARPVLPPSVDLLPSAERRRAGLTVRLAIAAGIEALTRAGRDTTDMAMVFTASGGDGDTIHDILSVLATEQREVSPTRFHNSVHNTPSGYWAVATGSRAPSTSLSAYDGSFIAGLLEATVQAIAQNRPVTLIAYDVPYPEPLHAARPIVSAFGIALVLLPCRSDRAIASISVAAADILSPDTVMSDAELERLRLGNPAAQGLPLLAAIAGGDVGRLHMDGFDITVIPG